MEACQVKISLKIVILTTFTISIFGFGFNQRHILNLTSLRQSRIFNEAPLQM